MGHDRIVFTRFQGNAQDVFNELYSIDPDGNNEVCLTANRGSGGITIDNAAPRYNKDKTLLAFLSTKNNPNKRYNIFFLDLANKKTAQVTSGNLDMTSVDWAPDDSRLVFSCKDGAGLQQVHLVNLDGSGFTQLTGGPSESMNPRWSPDGGLIVFTQFPQGGKTSQVCVMDPKGKDLVKLTTDETFHSNPSWSPDGSWIVYQCSLGTPHLRKSKVNTREVIVFKAPASGADASPVWSGADIVFSSNRDWEGGESLFNLYRMSDNGENLRRLTNSQTFEYCGDW
jgi:Tol biopolymer transport system component